MAKLLIYYTIVYLLNDFTYTVLFAVHILNNLKVYIWCPPKLFVQRSQITTVKSATRKNDRTDLTLTVKSAARKNDRIDKI